MKKILLSIATIALVGGVAAGMTGAFYGDTETSTGNTFTAGSLELKVDSKSHYNSMVCTDMGDADPRYQWQPEAGFDPGPYHFPKSGSECNGTWEEADLVDGVHKFFDFTDLKPGDEGEDTISLHVYDNDAWGRFLITPIRDADNTCTEPEQEAEGGLCEDPDGDGEIDDNLRFTAWLDQGETPGFQGDDPGEGDNVFQPDFEGPLIWDNELIGNLGPFDLSEVFGTAYQIYCLDDAGAPLASPDGHDDYGLCHGLAEDGRMVGSTTYYFGLAWNLDLMDTGNEAQTDEYTADMTFMIEQHRNNPNPFQLN